LKELAGNPQEPYFPLSSESLTSLGQICNLTTLTFDSCDVPGAVQTWTTSSNLQVVNSNDYSVTVDLASTNAKGDGWIKSTFNNGQVIQKNVWVGKPDPVTRLSHVATFGCTMGEINVVSGGGTDEYEWLILGGTIVIPNVNSNSYTGQGVVFVDPNDGPYGFTVKVRAKNDCGYSAWYIEDIPTNCPTGGGGITRLGGSSVLDDIVVFFPNPANESIFVNLDPLDSNGNGLSFQIKITDFNGSIVFETQTNRILEQIDASTFKNGIYILNLSNGEKSITEKLIIQH
tara:strand:- start:197 stop:1057 length:861 start_codon:yes stop_codon:yes gene_type:complete